MSGRSQTTGTAGGETHRSRWTCRRIPPCSRGSWGRNTRGCCARPEDSSSILAARTRSGGGVEGQSGAKQNRRRLDDSLSTTRQNLRFSVCGKYRKKKKKSRTLEAPASGKQSTLCAEGMLGHSGTKSGSSKDRKHVEW